MRGILREPLLHFLAVGVLLFLVFGMTDKEGPSASGEEIVVSPGRIEQLTSIFTKTWQRSPSRVELQGLIDDFVLEEVYYRQAIALGIDRDDTIIRRRLRQKFEFLTDDMTGMVTPTDKELEDYLADNEQKFRRQSTYSFEQLYVNPEDHSGRLDDYVSGQLAALRSGHTPDAGLGLLPRKLDEASTAEVDALFGRGFATSLDGLTTGEWIGPVPSGLGMHLIRLESRTSGSVPPLDEVREIVRSEWANVKRIESRQAVDKALLQGYEVIVEWPSEPTDEDSKET